jgi:hypothetical protein
MAYFFALIGSHNYLIVNRQLIQVIILILNFIRKKKNKKKQSGHSCFFLHVHIALYSQLEQTCGEGIRYKISNQHHQRKIQFLFLG